MRGGQRVTWPDDDFVMPFTIEGIAVRGRVLRLGPALDRILKAHDYPLPVSRLVGEAVALVALLGTALKLDATFTLQTRSDGPVRMIVADFRSPGAVRGLAQFEPGALAAAEDMLGRGSLAFTIDPGGDMERYQGIVALEGNSLVPAALHYFAQSEQIPALLRIAAGEVYTRDAEGHGHVEWRAGAVLLQRVPAEGGEGDLQPVGEDDWTRFALLVNTLSDDELIDPRVTPDLLAYRLFHEDGVRAYPAHEVAFGCRCSRERVEAILRSYGPDELFEFIEGGIIRMTCEFCGTNYDFDPGALGEDAQSGA